MSWFLKNVGQLPMDRSGGRASATSMDGVLGVLRRGELIGIYPEGTRSPDGRLYKGKTGVARLVLQAGVPVVPIGMVDSQFVPSTLFKIPIMRRPRIRSVSRSTSAAMPGARPTTVMCCDGSPTRSCTP